MPFSLTIYTEPATVMKYAYYMKIFSIYVLDAARRKIISIASCRYGSELRLLQHVINTSLHDLHELLRWSPSSACSSV